MSRWVMDGTQPEVEVAPDRSTVTITRRLPGTSGTDAPEGIPIRHILDASEVTWVGPAFDPYPAL